jgi:hypothetical protein
LFYQNWYTWFEKKGHKYQNDLQRQTEKTKMTGHEAMSAVQIRIYHSKYTLVYRADLNYVYIFRHPISDNNYIITIYLAIPKNIYDKTTNTLWQVIGLNIIFLYNWLANSIRNKVGFLLGFLFSLFYYFVAHMLMIQR